MRTPARKSPFHSSHRENEGLQFGGVARLLAMKASTSVSYHTSGEISMLKLYGGTCDITSRNYER